MTPRNDLVLTTEQNWAARSHRELYDSVHQNNDPGTSGELGWHWEQFGSGLAESAQTISRELAATESGWTGASADAARAAIGQLTSWLTETGQHATELGAKIQEQGRIMAAARAAMPEPVEFSWDAATGTLSGPGIASFAASAADVQAANEQARAAHDQAVTVMTEMERQSRAVDAATPVFTAPFNPTTGRVEEIGPTSPRAEGTGPETETVVAPRSDAESGESPVPAEDGTPVEELTPQVLTAATGVPVAPAGAGAVPPPEQGYYSGQVPSVQGGTAVAAAAAAGAGAGAFALRGVGGAGDESDRPRRSAGPGGPGGFPVAPGAEPGATPGTTPHSAAASAQRSGGGAGGTPAAAGGPGVSGGLPAGGGVGGGAGGLPAGGGVGGGAGGLPAGGGAGARTGRFSGGLPTGGGAGGSGGGGGGGGARTGRFSGGLPTGGGAGGGGGLGGMRGRARGQQGEGDITLSPGRQVGATDFDGPAPAGPNSSGVVGASAGTHPEGGMMPPGVGRTSGGEDTERKTAYVQSEDIFDVPGDELPPSVIGGRKVPREGEDT